MIEQTTRYGFATTVHTDHARAVELVRQELREEGFGVLSEMDMAGTLKQKLGVDHRPYVILGACNPPLAHRALSEERDLGLLLPCNVVVYESDVPGDVVVAAMDPVAALSLTENERVAEVATEVRSRLEQVLLAVEREAAAPAPARAHAAGHASHYDGDHPEEPLPIDHFSAEERAEARHLGDGSPAVEPRVR